MPCKDLVQEFESFKNQCPNGSTSSQNQITNSIASLNKCVSFHEKPEVCLLEEEGDPKGSNLKDCPEASVNKSSNKEFCLFYSNITSLSKHAMEYLFALPPNILMLMLVETHKEEAYTKSQFSFNDFNTTCSPPEVTSEMGTHGGEVIAVKKMC